MRALSVAVPIAFVICAAAPAFANAQSQVQAARKAERKGEWKKALEAWKAAYAADVNAEYLIGIGDCYARLGNADEAKKNYNAYLADPLALPANVEKVKTKLAELDSPAGALALPGGGLALPGSDAPPPLPSAAPPPLPGLDLPGSAPVVAEEKGGRRGKRNKKGADLAPPPLPGLDLPGAPPALADNKKADGPGLALPGLDLPASPPPSKKEPEKLAAASPPGLDLPGLPGLPMPTATPPPAPKPEKKEQPAVATNTPPPTHTTAKPPASSLSGKTVAMTTPPPATKPDSRHVPEAAIADAPIARSQPEASGGTSRVVAFVAAGVAVAALGGGAYAFTKAGSAHTELTGKVHDGATAQSLLADESKNKTLSFVGLASGLVAAGIATALFAF
jgi:hypothetical protein